MIATDFGCGIVASLTDADVVSIEDFTKIDENLFRCGNRIVIANSSGAIMVSI